MKIDKFPLDTMVVCAYCRRPVGVGMQVMVMHVDDYVRLCRILKHPTHGLYDQPVMVCMSCGRKFNQAEQSARVQ